MTATGGDVSPDEFKRAVALIRSGRSPLRLSTAAEVLDAAKLGVISKAEARKLLGLRKRPQPAALRRKP